jgi:putative N6-adenine-specific DNA methylase
MSSNHDFEIFLVAFPGLESALCAEAQEKGFAQPTPVLGGVTIQGDWGQVWRANLMLRGASRVLVRIGAFHAMHLAQLDKRCRRLPWTEILRPDVPVRIDAVSSKKSRIYHAGAIKERFARALEEEMGITISAEAELCVKIRMDDDLCTVSIDSSGEPLHKRNHKEAVNKAPLRETLAALFLRQSGFSGAEPIVDPMCGSGTFTIEAAEIAIGLNPGRSRSFAFEHLVPFDADAWKQMQSSESIATPTVRFYGSDRDAGAVRMSQANAERAGVSAYCEFSERAIGDLFPPAGPCGLVMINPPYGERLGDKKQLLPLYRTLGRTLSARFGGWRVGLITSEDSLAKATGLPFASTSAPVSHGGLTVKLYNTGVLTRG